ncbi:MAG: T9SS type A sorting domain-containing protein [Bacteroidia bacterium]
MKLIKTTLVALAVLGATVHTALAQMNYWTMPPKKFNMTTATPTSTTQGGNGAYSVANAAYDANGATLFYVRNGAIFSNTNVLIGNLPLDCANAYGWLGAQIGIVPIPGACKQYYVIYSLGALNNNGLYYVKVNCSGATPILITNGTATCGNVANDPLPFFINSGTASVGNAFNVAFAITKVYTGSGATAKRFLYAVCGNGIVRAEISSTGIAAVTSVATNTDLGLTNTSDLSGIDVDLSWDNSYLAWSSSNGKVFTMRFDPTNNYLWNNQFAKSYNVAGARGVEFDNSTTTPKLYVSCTGGVKQILTSNFTVSNVTIAGAYDLSNTQLEMGKNGKIYGVSPIYTSGTLTGTNMVGILTTTNAISAISTGTSPAFVDSRFVIGGNPLLQYNMFTVPTQIDGENYTYANGNVNLTGFTINNLGTTGDCDNGGIRVFCQNGNFAFNPITLGGTPAQYKFSITPACADVNAINYVGTWTTGQPSANFNLSTLTDGVGKNLTNITGFVTITYSVKDACDVVTTVSYLLNVIAPIPPVMDLRIYSAGVYTPVTATAGSTPANAIAVGTATLGYSTNNSTGTITNRTVIVDEVNSSGGVIYSNIINTGALAYTAGGSGTPFDGLNSYCVSTAKWANYNVPGTSTPLTGLPSAACTGGWKGYFAYTNGVPTSYNKIFRITVTLSNACNSVTKVAYVTPTCQGCKFASPTGITQNTITNSNVSVYPNPASNNITLNISADEDAEYTMQLIDVLGKVVINMPATQIAQGEFTKTFDISTLQVGVYTYRITSGTSYKAGIITKQ